MGTLDLMLARAGGLLLAALVVAAMAGVLDLRDPALTEGDSTPVTPVTPVTTRPIIIQMVDPATSYIQADRIPPQLQLVSTLPPPSTTPSLVPPRHQWGQAGSSEAGRCTQWEPLLAALQPPGGWPVHTMSQIAARESGCCPQVQHEDGWHTTQGGDRFDAHCRFSHVAAWHHRSDAGLFQINGIHYDPARCHTTCLQDILQEPINLVRLGDAVVNVRVAADLCVRAASCLSPWT